jgi:protein tyrosine phosphatase (PTP) superfamily phosphohydrolase (DUF442 family)
MTDQEPQGTFSIRNHRRISDDLITGGQPTEAQLRAAAAEGVRTVINLATVDPERSLPDEAGLVRSLGMAYHHIPVDWSNPTEDDFRSFERLVPSISPGLTLIHCMANYRVTAFVALYGIGHLDWTEEQANALVASVWNMDGYPAWKAFYAGMKARLAE